MHFGGQFLSSGQIVESSQIFLNRASRAVGHNKEFRAIRDLFYAKEVSISAKKTLLEGRQTRTKGDKVGVFRQNFCRSPEVSSGKEWSGRGPLPQ